MLAQQRARNFDKSKVTKTGLKASALKERPSSD
jgi:hypothetical protein